MSAGAKPPTALPYAVTDHALLRWMQRVHGVDVDLWRHMLREEVAASVEAFDGRAETYGPAFLLNPDGTVVTFIAEGQRVMRGDDNIVAVRRRT